MTLTFFALLAAALLVGSVAAARHLGAYLKWEAHATRGDQFFGLKSEERSAFKAVLHERSGLAHAIIRLMALLRPPPKAPPTFFYEGIGFPRTTSSRRLLEAAMAYQPSAEDVFVASHMKSGTTWTLYLLFQILQHGRGDLSDEGYGHIHAACPWLETRLAVGLDRAPRLGDPPRRIIKTHLNAEMCPFDAEARYVVVARQPSAVCASSIDFLRMMSGPLAPSAEFLADWWTSPSVMWGPWSDHILGWWRKSLQHDNVFFVSFEEMKTELPTVIGKLAAFLGVALSESEVAIIAQQCGFAAMKAEQDRFDMSPPNLFSVRSDAAFLKTGSSDRGQDLPRATQAKIDALACTSLQAGGFPVSRYFPELLAREGASEPQTLDACQQASASD